jgi:hypothetical protein
VWGDDKGARGLCVCAPVEVCVFEGDGGDAIGVDEYVVHFCGE